jgi:proline racemase
MLTTKTIDAHAEGGPLRLVVDGFPAPRGRTMHEKLDWVRRHTDHLRRQLMLAPRGHADLAGAVLTEPTSPGSHAGVIFMHAGGFSALSGHGIAAVTRIALDRGLVVPGGDGRTVVFDTAVGTIRASVATGPDRRVTFTNVPSFVLLAGLPVRLGARHIRADVAFGGAFYAIVDSEAAGLPIDVAHLPELRRAGTEIKRAVEAAREVLHPLDARIGGVFGTVFTSPSSDGRSDLRGVTIFGDAQVDPSPGGTGASAVMAVLEAMGLLDADRPFVLEGLIGSRVACRLAARTSVGALEAIVPEIDECAWITGEHTFVAGDDDPWKEGYRLV